jgi:hypothetical protein
MRLGAGKTGFGSAYESRTQFGHFVISHKFRHKHAIVCALEEETQIRQFARFAQIYAVPVSDFVRKKQLAGFTALVLVSPLHAPEATRIV